MTWLSQAAAVADVNGDGSPDIVGRVEWSTPAQQDTKLAAFDGPTGEALWQSDELALHSDDSPGPLVVAGETLVLPANMTTLRGFRLRDGSELWTSRLSEKLGMLCRGPQEGTIAVQTADKLWQTLTLADGALAALQWEGPCLPLEGDSAYLGRSGQLQIEGPFQYPLMALDGAEGLSGSTAIYDTETKISIALVAKRPGTAVPMLARYEHQAAQARILAGNLRSMRTEVTQEARKLIDPKWYAALKKVPKTQVKLLWTVPIPSGDPLKATEGAVPHRNVALQGDVIVAAYESSANNFSLAAFGVEDGSRRWEVAMLETGYIGRVLATPEHVYIVRRNGLTVYHLETGERTYSIPASP